jgi:MFS family permease
MGALNSQHGGRERLQAYPTPGAAGRPPARAIVRAMSAPRAMARAPWPVFATVALGTFMSTLDASIVNVALPTLQDAFDASMTAIGGVSIAYPLTLTLLLLPAGRLGDALGRRRVYQAGLALFVIGSLLCGIAPSAWFLVAARILQGAGASLVTANGTAIVTAAFPAAMRGRALGSIGAVVGTGLTVGPALGGWILEVSGWPAIFLVNVPIGILAIALAARFVPPNPGDAVAARAPLFDPVLLGDRAFAGAMAALFLSFVSLFVAVFLAPFYLENVTGLGPAAIGRVLVVAPLLLLAVAPFAGALSDRIGTRRLAAGGLGLIALGLVLLAVLVSRAVEHPAGVPEMVAGLFVVGLGQGLFQAPNSSAAMGLASRLAAGTRLGLAGGFMATMRNFGMVVGIALAALTYEGREAAYQAGGAGVVAAAGGSMRDALVVGALAALLGVVIVLRSRREDTVPTAS